MSNISSMAKTTKQAHSDEKTGAVINFMDGISYKPNPLETLKMVTASSIFGEPQYYRKGEFADHAKDGCYELNQLFKDYSVLDLESKPTSELMEDIIDEALDYDFDAVLDWAVTLRKEYNMRLNPQIIMVRAAMHEKRQAWSDQNPGKFHEINQKVMFRADEPASQLTYYSYRNEGKKNCPNILKRSWAKQLSELDAYAVNKYKNHACGMIDVVRVSHAHSGILDELMKTGSVNVPASKETWEQKRSAGMSWKEILETTSLGHMALLRNLRNIFTEIDDLDTCEKLLEQLKNTVKSGKQFPFRYYTAHNRLQNAKDVHFLPMILDALEACMDISLENMPKLRGKTMCLSDNSGSAWGAIPSEYGTVTIAEIGNLSSVITAMGSDEGYVAAFGDKLIMLPAKKRSGCLDQAKMLSKEGGNVGGSTENGIWLFFDKAIQDKEHWDNIFIYSDQQAGHGGLYGTEQNIRKYRKDYGARIGGRYVDVAKLINTYRQQVNPKVNVFSVQTAGYDNVVIPEYGYRTNILYGWTGKELVFADTMIRLWDEHDRQKNQ